MGIILSKYSLTYWRHLLYAWCPFLGMIQIQGGSLGQTLYFVDLDFRVLACQLR